MVERERMIEAAIIAATFAVLAAGPETLAEFGETPNHQCLRLRVNRITTESESVTLLLTGATPFTSP